MVHYICLAAEDSEYCSSTVCEEFNRLWLPLTDATLHDASDTFIRKSIWTVERGTKQKSDI